jgi:biotin transport system substrate-specific component
MVNMKNTLSADIRKMVYASLFCALIIVGSYIAIPLPISPVPIVLANFFVMLAGLLLEKWWAAGSVGLYLFLGILGLPVFANGSGGVVHLIGPTGGFLVGYLFCAFVIAFITERGNPSWFKDLIALVMGVVFLFVPGLVWLKAKTGLSWSKVLAVGMIPFLIGDVIKIAAAVGLARVLRPIIISEGLHPKH